MKARVCKTTVVPHGECLISAHVVAQLLGNGSCKSIDVSPYHLSTLHISFRPYPCIVPIEVGVFCRPYQRFLSVSVDYRGYLCPIMV